MLLPLQLLFPAEEFLQLLEDLLEGGKVYTPFTEEMLSYIDTLVDGQFIESQKDITLKFRGSANQRILDLNEK